MPDISAANAPSASRTLASGRAMACAVLLGCCVLVACQPTDAAKPDILLITIDTLRADHLGVYGFSADSSPNIDALAGSGVVFERAIAAASRTVPAHASIMTSRPVREHSVGHRNGQTKLQDQATIAEHFQAAGYRTAAFIGNILITRVTGLDRGFDLYDDELTTPELNRPGIVERIAEDTTARAIAWLRAQGDTPLFIWVHYQDPHGPYTPPAEDAARFDSSIDEDEPALAVGKSNQAVDSIPPYQVLPGLRRPSEYRSRYAGEIFHADRAVGALVAALDARADARGAVVMLTADHGESFGENGRFFLHTHASTPDVAHVPLIVRAPGLAAGRRNELVGHVDVMPTLLDLAGLRAPADARGVALAPIARGEAMMPDRYLYCDLGSQLSAYRGDGFTLVHGVGDAWNAGDAHSDLARAPWRRFRWQPGEPWQPIDQGRGRLPEPILAYAQHAVPMAMLPPPDPALIEQLTALGYADGGDDVGDAASRESKAAEQ